MTHGTLTILIALVVAMTGCSLQQTDSDRPPIAGSPRSSSDVERGITSAVDTRRGTVVAIKAGGDRGSGIIFSRTNLPGYYIVTNEHVMRKAAIDNADFEILFPSGKSICRVKKGPSLHILGEDVISDLAVLRLTETKPCRNKIDAFDIDKPPLEPRTGMFVMAMGSPFGLFDTTTFGIVSNARRALSNAQRTPQIVIQTDAAINEGNSGGPLIDLEGNLLGINTSGFPISIADNTSFAIPWTYAQSVIHQLIDNKVVKRAGLGILLQRLVIEYRTKRGPDVASSELTDFGVVVEQDERNLGNEDKLAGALICKINGQPVRNQEEYHAEVLRISRNDDVKVSYLPDWRTGRANSQCDSADKMKTVDIRADSNRVMGGWWFSPYLAQENMGNAYFADFRDERLCPSEPDSKPCGVVIQGLSKKMEESGLRNGDVVLEIQFGLDSKGYKFSIDNIGRLKNVLERFNKRRREETKELERELETMARCMAAQSAQLEDIIPEPLMDCSGGDLRLTRYKAYLSQALEFTLWDSFSLRKKTVTAVVGGPYRQKKFEVLSDENLEKLLTTKLNYYKELSSLRRSQ